MSAALVRGVAAGAVVTAIESATLGGAALALHATVAALLIGLGAVVGSTLSLADRLYRVRPNRWSFGATHALVSFGISIPASRTLFDGAFASTLPLARWGPVWVPVLLYGCAALGLVVADAVVARLGHRRMVVAVVAVVAVVGLELANRRLFRFEYADLHAALSIAEVVLVTSSLMVIVPARPLPRPWLWVPALVAALVGLNVWSAYAGLESPEARRPLQTDGVHGRTMVRVARALTDSDGDTYSARYGGGDCDDDDPQRHPGAQEVPGNEDDEDCDGVAASGRLVDSVAAAHADTEDWLSTPEGAALVERTRGMNVLLVVVDGLRADAVDGSDAPNLTSLMDASVSFSWAFSAAAGTDYSMGAVYTGHVNAFAAAGTTLAEAMRAAGKVTHAIIPSEVLRYVGKPILTLGLDSHTRLVNDREERDVGSFLTSKRLTQLALEFVDRSAGKPWFLSAHYFDVHEHEEIKSIRAIRVAEGGDVRLERYRAVVRVVDQEIGALLAGLEAAGVADKTIVVFLADHGEGLGAEPRLPLNHGRVVYNPLVRVPLAFRIPGVAPRTVTSPVSLLDVYPTLAALAGVATSELDGESLAAWFGAEPPQTPGPRPLVLNESDQYGVVLWPHKLVAHRDSATVELYDLAVDPNERIDQASSHKELVAELLAVYGSLPAVELLRTTAGRAQRDAMFRAAHPR